MASKPRPRLVLLGDSITQQSFSLERHGWGAALADLYQQKVDVINRGASGYNTRWTLSCLPSLIPENEPAPLVTVIFFGANDAAAPGLPGTLSTQHVPVDEYELNLVKIVTHIKRLGCRHVFIVTPPPVDNDKWVRFKNDVNMAVPGQRSLANTQLYAAAAKRAAATSGAEVVDLHEALVKCPNWSDMLHDGLHFASGASQLFYKLLSSHLNRTPEPALADLPFALPYWATN